MKSACGSYIREIAVQPGTASSVVIGGFDQHLNFLDLNRADTPYVQRLDLQGAIGSIKWCPYNNSEAACMFVYSALCVVACDVLLSFLLSA